MKLSRALVGAAAVILFVSGAPLQAFASASGYSGTLNAAAKTMSVDVRDADVRDVLSAIALNMDKNIVYKGEAHKVTVKLDEMPTMTAFDYVLRMLGMTYLQEGSTLIVASRDILTRDFARAIALTNFKLKYISGVSLTQKIQQLDLPVTVITMETNENNLWVQGFPADVAKVRELITVLDIAENGSGEDGEISDPSKKSLSYIKLKYLDQYEFSRFLKVLGVGKPLPISSDDEKLWIYATAEERNVISNLRSRVDRESADISISQLDTTSFVRHDLRYITAAEAERRLKGFKFGGEVKWYTSTHPEFANTIFIYAEQQYIEQVETALGQIDQMETGSVHMPVYIGDATDVPAYQEYLETMLKIPSASFGTFPGLGADKNILYLIDPDPATVKLVEQMLERLSKITSGDATQVLDLSVAAYMAATGDTTPTLEEYADWVAARIGSSGITGFSGGFSDSVGGFSDSFGSFSSFDDEEAAPTGTELIDEAKLALDSFFESEFIPGTATDMSVVSAAAQAELEALGIAVTLSDVQIVEHVLPTRESQGRLNGVFTLNADGYWEQYGSS